MPGVSVTVGEQIEALRRAAGKSAVRLVRHVFDPVIDAMFATIPGRFDTRRAVELGFRPDTSFDAIVRAHIKDNWTSAARRSKRPRRWAVDAQRRIVGALKKIPSTLPGRRTILREARHHPIADRVVDRRGRGRRAGRVGGVAEGGQQDRLVAAAVVPDMPPLSHQRPMPGLNSFGSLLRSLPRRRPRPARASGSFSGARMANATPPPR